MNASMLAGDSKRTGVLRLLRAAIKNNEIKLGHKLDEPEVLKVLQREAKQRRDSIEAFRLAERKDLLVLEESELTVIASYLPEAMTTQELAKIVDEIVISLGATDIKQVGLVMGVVMKQVGAQADGGAVSSAVRLRLSA